MIRVTFPDGYEDREDGTTCRLDTRSDFESSIDLWRGTDVLVKRGDVWTSCLVETFEEQIARLEGERDAAEKRLADLRAWADDIVKRSREEAPKHPGKADTTWTILSVLEWVVERIDGKDGESK